MYPSKLMSLCTVLHKIEGIASCDSTDRVIGQHTATLEDELIP